MDRQRMDRLMDGQTYRQKETQADRQTNGRCMEDGSSDRQIERIQPTNQQIDVASVDDPSTPIITFWMVLPSAE